MKEWIARRLQALEGNIVYAILVAVGIYVVSLGPATAFKTWLHKPVTNLGMACWAFVPVGILFIAALIHRYAKPKLEVDVVPTSVGSPNQYLVVRNLGRPNIFRAECQIVGGRHLGGDFRRDRFYLGWDDGRMRNLLLPHESTGKLLVSQYLGVAGTTDLSVMRLMENVGNNSVSHDSARWNEHPDELMPAFVLQVFIFADKVAKPLVKKYQLRPEKYYGPLLLQEIE